MRSAAEYSFEIIHPLSITPNDEIRRPLQASRAWDHDTIKRQPAVSIRLSPNPSIPIQSDRRLQGSSIRACDDCNLSFRGAGCGATDCHRLRSSSKPRVLEHATIEIFPLGTRTWSPQVATGCGVPTTEIRQIHWKMHPQIDSYIALKGSAAEGVARQSAALCKWRSCASVPGGIP